MDLVVQLPPSQGYDAIYVCVDRFTKMAHFIATNSNITAEGTADLYLRNVFKATDYRKMLFQIEVASLWPSSLDRCWSWWK